MKVNFARGSLFVKNAEGEVVRLAWEKCGEAEVAPGIRALPPGQYTLAGYRIARRDDTGREWFLSAIGAGGIRKFAVRPGRVTALQIAPAVTTSVKPHVRDDGRLAVRFGLQGHGDGPVGVTIYREGERIPMGYSITAAGGAKIEAGKLNYG